jgi:hypothetical protein
MPDPKLPPPDPDPEKYPPGPAPVPVREPEEPAPTSLTRLRNWFRLESRWLIAPQRRVFGGFRARRYSVVLRKNDQRNQGRFVLCYVL